MDLPVAGAYFPSSLHWYFNSKSQLCWYTTDNLELSPVRSGVIGVVCGSERFIRHWLPSLPSIQHCIVCVEPNSSFRGMSRKQKDRRLLFDRKFLSSLGLAPVMVAHSAYGGCTSARHICGFGSAICKPSEVPRAPANVRRTLTHYLKVAVEGYFPPHPPPSDLPEDDSRHCVRFVDKSSHDIVRRDGLLPCEKPDTFVLCPSVFGPVETSHHIKRRLTMEELVCIYSIPAQYHKDILLKWKDTKHILPFEMAVSSDIIASFVHQLWGGSLFEGGGDVSVPEDTVSAPADSFDAKASATANPPKVEARAEKPEDVETENKADGETTAAQWKVDLDETERAEELEGAEPEKKHEGETKVEQLELELDEFSSKPEGRSDIETKAANTETELEEIKLKAQEKIRSEKDKGKAAKADDASVPVHHWNNLILEKIQISDGATGEDVSQAANVLRRWGLSIFWKKLRKACVKRLQTNYGVDWMLEPRVDQGKATDLSVEIHALSNILWHATEADWFEYKSGSALHYFRFPLFYQGIAKDGVPVFFEKSGPRSMKPQPPMTDDNMRATVAAKIAKVIKRGYVFSSGIRLFSLIKYFAVPKTETDYRLVYDATANKLNEAVWAPSFWLPTVDTLVRYIDGDTWMMDRDIGDMFLNFPLDKKVWPYTGLHIGDLFDEDTEEGAEILRKAGANWVHWGRCLMGFKPSPYNAIKTSLVVEEVVKGDRHNDENPFQWNHVRLNLPGDENYDPRVSWISKMRKDGLIACDLFTFVDDERCSGPTRELAWQAGHRLAYIQAYLGIQDAARKVRPVSKTCGAWAGAVVHVVDDLGVCVLTSEEKWCKFKDILRKWLERLEEGETELDHKELLSDRGFCVYLTKSYPPMIPYLKGFHLTIEMWRGNRDEDGWKLPAHRQDYSVEEEDVSFDVDAAMLSQKIDDKSPQDEKSNLTSTTADVSESDDDIETEETQEESLRAPKSGVTTPVPRFLDDLKALLHLSHSDTPPLRVVRSKLVFTAVYGFGDASGKGFCGTLGYHDFMKYRIGVWGSDVDSESSNFKELLNLVETTEEEAAAGRLCNSEFYLFTDNSTAENSFYRGSSKSRLLHELVLRLRRLEVDYNLIIHVIHVAGTRMIAQGTDGGSRGSLLEGVMTGKPMLNFVELSRTGVERHPALLDWVRAWTNRPELLPLTPEQWFVEGHGICGGKTNEDGIWIPFHERRHSMHLWCPPPAVADAALEELLKARHKRTDTYHIILIPRLMTPRWRRLFYKACDFSCVIPAGFEHWPSNMFEPIYLGIVLPFTHHRPWQLKRAPLLLELERKMRSMLGSGESDGRVILQQLLDLHPRLCSVRKDVACRMLHMPREATRRGIPDDGDGR